MFLKKLIKSKSFFWSLITICIISYLDSIILVCNDDITFRYRWIAFGLHISSLIILFFLYGIQSSARFYLKKAFSQKEINPIILLLIVCAIANFTLLSFYPYVSISDELRDGGFFTMKIASGAITNIFGYGSYDAHGLIIPTLDIPFYYLFKNSTLVYRGLAALLSTADVLFLYLLIRMVVNRTTAFWSALILATLPLHMFFAHTQIVIGFNFFWVPIILLLLFILLKKHRFIDYIFLGAIGGFVFGFHAAIRAFDCMVFSILFFLEFRTLLMKKIPLDETVRTRLHKLVLMIVFMFVGFGPRLLFTGPQDFFHTSRFVFNPQIQAYTQSPMQKIDTLKNNYIDSLLLYVYKPTSFFYPDHKPLFSPFLALFFVLGVGYALFVLKNSFLNIMLFILGVLPFFTSAITDWVNADHRASPLFAIASVFVALGISYCLILIKNTKIRYLFIGILSVYLSLQVLTFYTEQPANKNSYLRDYMTMHILYFLQSDSPAQVCLIVSPKNYQYFNNNVGIQEQQKFLLPTSAIHFMKDPTLYNNQVTILKKQCPEDVPQTTSLHTYAFSCVGFNKFACPLNYLRKIIIYY